MKRSPAPMEHQMGNRDSDSLDSRLDDDGLDDDGLDDDGLDNDIVEELTRRLPTSELVKIIKNALECGRRNEPFTETDLLRAMTFGTSSMYLRAQRGSEAVAVQPWPTNANVARSRR